MKSRPTKFPGGVHLPRRNRTTQGHARSPVLRGHDHDQHLHGDALDANDRKVEIDELVAAVGDGFDKIAKMP